MQLLKFDTIKLATEQLRLMTHYQDGLLASPSDQVYSSLKRQTNKTNREDLKRKGKENLGTNNRERKSLTTERKDWSFTIQLDSDYA
ncbi:unnamed protein product [Dimorphilus gyrociliatus]|uniref:Uncharacterized protein n=1 Tax=Dimorphilus gyrociliatus TaxID=2664684 RepID=A0A7I8VKN9_9ANNE|nr:unnamed protein product [Dimorphilus gyrociliatus]